MSALQGNDFARPRRIAAAAGARTTLQELGITWTEVERTLRHLPTFVEEQHLWYSVANGFEVGKDELLAVRIALALAA